MIDTLEANKREVKVREQLQSGPKCFVTENVVFQFNSSYYAESPGIVRHSLHCDLVDPTPGHKPEQVSEALDDVLVLGALAEGRSIPQTGWKARYENGGWTRCYDRNFTPPVEKEIDRDETLIAAEDIEAFLNRVAPTLAKLSSRNALKQAVRFTISGQRPSIASSFMLLFTAMETLLNVFRSQHNVETIIPKERWRELRRKAWSVLVEDEFVRALTPDQRSAFENRFAQMNRLSFSDAFKRMHDTYQIELGDLWPMIDSKGAGLYDLRNRIVHGRLFASNSEWFRLISAKYHLTWTLERSILTFLGWPIERSRVSSRVLSQQTVYASWAEDYQYFSSLKEKRT